MTEYGRGSGSQPWHPDDPLYGDQGYSGQQQHPQQAPYGHGQQQYGWDPSQSQGGQQQYVQQGGDTYGGGQADYYGTPEGYQQQPQHPQHQQPHGQPQQGQQGHQEAQQLHQAQQHEQQQQQAQQQQPPVPYQSQQEWSEPDEEKISLFDDLPPATTRPGEHDGEPGDGRDDEDDEPREERSRGRDRRGKKSKSPKKNKRRSGTACLVVAVVLLGVVGGGGYVAYDYWQTHFGAAPDYEGQGGGQVQVEIPKGASLTEMGKVLQEAGVVKSVGAFTNAAAKKAIQPGTYTLHKEMSGAAAVEMMTNAGNFLTISEGQRAGQIYAAIDKKLGLAEGTTKGAAKSQAKNLGLPEWAGTDPSIKDPLEGFLFPSQYSAGKGTKPEEILRQMVTRARENYAKQDLEGKAKELGLKSPLQVITVASLVQAEGRYKHDFDKVSRVIYNRLKPDNKETYGLLDFDSTVNYAKNTSTLDTGAVSDLRQFKDPYNTYKIKGLPPGPINNPGLEALKSALAPAPGPWYYFVSINENETLFAVTNEEHNKNRERYNKEHKKGA
ncbi:endolytic transglycosylase MltG [Streptomyces roseoverticillatus]|uniref:endolytic transglycosylase MltG n=1 Tax=Streptomyces roseoverticillatus TaxID=66429 RepID=UPI001F3A255E|nr:endolytic transglycosylase MltG [Streptomyces roseoverticillatus]MCF3100877.1 endolytic transglycosylase MltG [Streptomyces roseoverticillatus]